MLNLLHQRVCALLCGALLVGCSSTPDLPAFTASGYLADRGVVRIWRKNSDHQSIHMRTVFTPFDGDAMETTDYSWLNNNLTNVERQVAGKQPDTVTLRFDQQGNLNFMQRQLAGRREAVSSDSVELYRFDAQRMLQQSNVLLDGRVLLSQGHWLGGIQVRTCEGKVINAPFDSSMVAALTQQQQRDPAVSLMVAWLEAPEGVQLLHITPTDECSWQPKESDF